MLKKLQTEIPENHKTLKFSSINFSKSENFNQVREFKKT